MSRDLFSFAYLKNLYAAKKEEKPGLQTVKSTHEHTGSTYQELKGADSHALIISFYSKNRKSSMYKDVTHGDIMEK